MTDRRTDGQTDGQTDARGKTICLPTLSGGDNNMSPDPVGGRHNCIPHKPQIYYIKIEFMRVYIMFCDDYIIAMLHGKNIVLFCSSVH